MARFPDVTISALTIKSFVEAFGNFSILATKHLLDEGVGKAGPDGLLVVEADAWYPLDHYLNAVQRITAEVGEQVMTQVGTALTRNAALPPHIDNVEAALTGLEAAHHMSHKLNGEPMFDAASGQVKDGIGHYRTTKTPNKNELIIVTDNAWPCSMDRGVLTGLGTRFKTKLNIAHEKSKGCRALGEPSCTYVVTWT
jgi:hypothetical protein